MKKTILFLVTLISFSAFSQSSLSINPLDYYYVEAGEECIAHFDVTNNSDSAVSVVVTRSFPNDSVSATMCWGSQCYGPTTSVTSLSTMIEVDSTESTFSAHILNMPEEVSYTINYCFSIENNPADKVCTDVLFTSSSLYIGIEENETTFGVYPNPAQNVLNLNYNSKKTADFVLYDMLGNVVYNDIVSNSKSIDLSRFESGIYFYSFSVKGEEKEVQKLIIAH